MHKTGVLKTINGHIEYYIDSDEKMQKGVSMHINTHTNDDKLLLQLDPFDIFNLWQVLDEYIKERQFKYHVTLRGKGN